MSQQGRPYVCTGCGAGSKAPVKLWREYQTFADHTELLCAACCTKRRKKPEDYGPIRSDGRCEIFYACRIPRAVRRKAARFYGRPGRPWPATERRCHGMSDQVADWMVPAVPTEDGTFWGYTSVPEDRCAWWRALPLTEAPDAPR